MSKTQAVTRQLLGSNCHSSYLCVYDPKAVGGVNSRVYFALEKILCISPACKRVSFVLEIE